MDPLAWLGLRKSKAHPNLAAIQDAVRAVLPDEEPVVIRYIVVVTVMLTRVAHSDGRLARSERDRLAALFRHIDRFPAEAVDQLCDTLNEQVPLLEIDELDVCYRELRSLCDADERQQVLRLLASLASADGKIAPSEHGELCAIAKELGVDEEQIEVLEIDAMSAELSTTLPPPGSVRTSSRPRAAATPAGGTEGT